MKHVGKKSEGKGPTAEERNSAKYWHDKYKRRTEDFCKLSVASTTSRDIATKYIDDLHWELSQLKAKVEVLTLQDAPQERAMRPHHQKSGQFPGQLSTSVPHPDFLRGFDMDYLLASQNTHEVKDALVKLHQLVIAMHEELAAADDDLKVSQANVEELMGLVQEKDERLEEWETAYNEVVAKGQLGQWETAYGEVVAKGHKVPALPLPMAGLTDLADRATPVLPAAGAPLSSAMLTHNGNFLQPSEGVAVEDHRHPPSHNFRESRGAVSAPPTSHSGWNPMQQRQWQEEVLHIQEDVMGKEVGQGEVLHVQEDVMGNEMAQGEVLHVQEDVMQQATGLGQRDGGEEISPEDVVGHDRPQRDSTSPPLEEVQGREGQEEIEGARAGQGNAPMVEEGDMEGNVYVLNGSSAGVADREAFDSVSKGFDGLNGGSVGYWDNGQVGGGASHGFVTSAEAQREGQVTGEGQDQRCPGHAINAWQTAPQGFPAEHQLEKLPPTSGGMGDMRNGSGGAPNGHDGRIPMTTVASANDWEGWVGEDEEGDTGSDANGAKAEAQERDMQGSVSQYLSSPPRPIWVNPHQQPLVGKGGQGQVHGRSQVSGEWQGQGQTQGEKQSWGGGQELQEGVGGPLVEGQSAEVYLAFPKVSAAPNAGVGGAWAGGIGQDGNGVGNMPGGLSYWGGSTGKEDGRTGGDANETIRAGDQCYEQIPSSEKELRTYQAQEPVGAHGGPNGHHSSLSQYPSSFQSNGALGDGGGEGSRWQDWNGSRGGGGVGWGVGAVGYAEDDYYDGGGV